MLNDQMRLLIALLLPIALLGAGPVLIVADEIPAMEVLAAKLKAGAGVESQIVTQENMPAKLDSFPVVLVYIHERIGEPAERAFIEYAEGGGRLILLHHSISSGKRRNKFWFPFLKIALPETPFEQGGYRWIEGVTLEVVNLAPQEFITSHKVAYPLRVAYRSTESAEQQRAGFHLEDTEVYLNHVFHGPRTLLLGFKYTDAKTGTTCMQDRAGWYMKAGRGLVMYFMPGHTVHEFENPVYAQILVNAVTFKP